VRLLTRTTRVVRVTEVGTAYFEDCRRILGEVDDAELSATGTHSTPRGQLTITAPMLFGKYFVMPVVIEYLSRYPQADVNAWFIDRVVNLVDEGIDVAVRIGEMPDSTLQAIRVGRVRRVLCASPAYLKEHGTPRRPEDLTSHTAILASGISTTPEWRLDENGKQTVVRLQPRLTTTTNDAAITAAVAGFGITRLLSYQIAQHLRDGSLEIVLADFEPPALPIQVVHREGRHATQKVRAFLDLAIDTLRAHPSLN
jgi:DNA-binding transcriptional LysR family regulator